MNAYCLCIGLTPAVQELREFAHFTYGEVNRALTIQRSTAGKGPNVARVLTQLGGRARLLGFAGGDTGRFVGDCLRREGVEARLTRTVAPTRTCITVRAQDTGVVTELVEEAAMPTPGEWARFFRAVSRARTGAGLMVIAGALMPGASPEVHRRLAALGVPLVIDSQREPLLVTLSARPLMAKLNVHELENTLGQACPDARAIRAGARELLGAGAQHGLVTDGPRGAWLVTREGVWHYQPPRLEAVNPIGSGDSVTAGICRALMRRRPMVEAVHFGVACGAANVLTRVAADVRPEDLHALLPRIRLRQLA